jgi:hypothetical protein
MAGAGYASDRVTTEGVQQQGDGTQGIELQRIPVAAPGSITRSDRRPDEEWQSVMAMTWQKAIKKPASRV